MKKIILTLSICFAMLLWGTSAKAIGDDNGMSAANAIDHSVGSYHGFKVNFDTTPATLNDHLSDHSGNYYKWKVFTEIGGTQTELADFNKFRFVSYLPTGADFATKFTANGTDLGTTGSYGAGDAYGVGIQWLDVNAPSAVYVVQVEEYNGPAATFCSARRQFYVSVTNGTIDFQLAALNATSNAEIVGTAPQADLTKCNSFSGNLIPNTGSPALGVSEFYYKVNMTTEGQDWNGQWGFDYTFTNLNSPAYEVKIVDAVGSTTEVGNITSESVVVNVSNPTVYVKVIVTNALGTAALTDYTLKMNVTSETPFIRITAGDDTSNKLELAAKNANNNQLTSYVINASPNVGAIGVD